jgi:hypothetical protein
MPPTILGISYKTRIQGLAVIKSQMLMDYSLKLHKDRWGPHKRDSILSSLVSCIKDYAITTICLSIPRHHQQTKEWKEIYVLIRSLAYQQKIRLVEYSPSELLSLCIGRGKRTKGLLMQSIASLYPELESYFHKEISNKNRYYLKLFEAVGVATLFRFGVKE